MTLASCSQDQALILGPNLESIGAFSTELAEWHRQVMYTAVRVFPMIWKAMVGILSTNLWPQSHTAYMHPPCNGALQRPSQLVKSFLIKEILKFFRQNGHLNRFTLA